jgi:1-phosphofructokinase
MTRGTTRDMPHNAPDAHPEARACVFAPSPLLTVTIEGAPDDGGPEVHLHAGGQGYWIARLVSALGIRVALCASFGGETGAVARGLLSDEGFDLRAVDASGANGAYVHDRRSGDRNVVADMPPSQLSRHEVDELYGTTLVEGLEADVTVLGGPARGDVLPADTYRRLASDLRANGAAVVADLAGERLDAVLEGGVTVLKVSHEELLRDGRVTDDAVPVLVAAMCRLRDAGAESVVVTRGDAPTLALVDGQLLEVEGPRVEPFDHRGAGDSLTAGLTAGVARGMTMHEALRLGVAAGGLNVTRRGLGSGNKDEIERLASHVEVRPLAVAGKR